MKALVSGGSGFVGANLVRALLAEGAEVHLLLRPGRDLWRLDGLHDRLHIHLASLLEAEPVRQIVLETRPDEVYHLAAYGAYPEQDDLRQALMVNLIGTLNLLQPCLEAGVGAFVNAGSSSEYGFTDHPPREGEAPLPNSGYAVGKASATLLAGHFGRQTGARIVSLRLYNIYGPYEEPTRFIPRLVLAALKGKLPPLVSAEVARDFTYVEDAVAAFLLAARHPSVRPGDIFNVGTGVQSTIGSAVDTCRRLLAVSREPVYASMPRRDWDTSVWVCDRSLVTQRLGWQPRHDFESGLARTIEWFREVGSALAAYRA